MHDVWKALHWVISIYVDFLLIIPLSAAWSAFQNPEKYDNPGLLISAVVGGMIFLLFMAVAFFKRHKVAFFIVLGVFVLSIVVNLALEA